MSLPNWSGNSRQITQRLSHSSILKICVKTKNESGFLRSWIEHHAKIVGYENLIIADNESDDSATLDFYNEIKEKVTIFQFGGSHNEIHWSPRFAELFDAIRSYSKFFAFIDVDERLISIDGESWDASSLILNIISNEKLIYATTWLINAPESYSMFSLLDTEHRPRLKNNLIWGKPILPSYLVGTQSGIHNVQFKNNDFALAVKPTLFLLHLTQFPVQRIAANRNKLRSRGLIDGSETDDEIVQLDFSSHPDPTAVRLQKEIVRMTSLSMNNKSSLRPDQDFIELSDSGIIRFSSEQAKVAMVDYLDQCDAYIQSLMNTE